MFAFPKDQKKADLWLKLINYPWKISVKGLRVCRLHFKEEDIISETNNKYKRGRGRLKGTLRENALPCGNLKSICLSTVPRPNPPLLTIEEDHSRYLSHFYFPNLLFVILFKRENMYRVGI